MIVEPTAVLVILVDTNWLIIVTHLQTYFWNTCSPLSKRLLLNIAFD